MPPPETTAGCPRLKGVGSMQGMAWLGWGALPAGIALAGLWGFERRLRRSGYTPAGGTSEIVLSRKILQVGAVARVWPQESADTGAWPAYISALEKATLTLTLEPHGERRPGRGAAAERLVSGAAIAVEITGADAIYRFTTPVRALESDARLPQTHLLTIARPRWITLIQRRRWPRFPVKWPAALEREDQVRALQTARSSPLSGTIIDLSEGGFCAEVQEGLSASQASALTELFAPGTVLRVRLPLPALAETPLLARIGTSRKMAARGGLGVRLGCEFMPMASPQRERLRVLISGG